MAKVSNAKSATSVPTSLTIDLRDAGLTPYLRAGLGGLAAALCAHGGGKPRWFERIEFDGGEASVDESSVTLRWGDEGPKRLLKSLFEKSFRLTKDQQIWLAGAYPEEISRQPQVVAALHNALRTAFLGHPQFAKVEKGGRQRFVFEIDEQQVQVECERMLSFVHQSKAELVADAIVKAEPVVLSSWAYPGATKRHIRYNETEASYSAAEALCALFAITGCVTFSTRHGAAIVVVEPTNLRQFARLRPTLTPKTWPSVLVAGAGDATLLIESQLRAEAIGEEHGVGVSVVLIGKVPWDAQRRVRVATIAQGAYSQEALDVYEHAAGAIKARVVLVRDAAKKAKKGEAAKPSDEPARVFTVHSALRAFVTDNLASGRRWFDGFATALDPNDPERFVHYFYDSKGKGALRAPEDLEGLSKMNKSLEEAEADLVESVQEAIRMRLGAISETTGAGNQAALFKRFENERTRIRLSLSQAKTHEQVRYALADLWSRAGTNKALQERWKNVLPFLREQHWRTARDLALVALASYRGRDKSSEAAGPSAGATDSTDSSGSTGSSNEEN